MNATEINELVAEKNRLMQMAGGDDVSSTLDNAEKVLAELNRADLMLKWLMQGFICTNWGATICLKLETNVQRYYGTCQHHMTHHRIARVLDDIRRTKKTYFTAENWSKRTK